MTSQERRKNLEKIIRERIFNVSAVGVTFNNPDGISRQSVVSCLSVEEEVELKREPDNKYDKNAVALYNSMDEQFGYISKEENPKIAKLLDKKVKYKANVSGVYGGYDGKNWGCSIRIEFED